MFKIPFLVLLASLFSSISIAYDFETFKTEIATPITTDASAITYTGGAISLILATAFRDTVVDDVQEYYSETKPLGDAVKYGEKLGRGYVNLAYFAVNYGLWKWGESENGYNRAIHMLKTTGYATLVTTVLKYTVRAERPNKSRFKTSFPSGHTTMAFSFASAVATQHEWYWGALAFSAATFAGVARIEENAHFLHDVVAGATIGTAFGFGLHYLYNINEDNSFMIMPQSNGVRLVYQY